MIVLPHLLKKEDQHFKCGAVLDVEQNGGVRFVIDNFQVGENDYQYVDSVSSHLGHLVSGTMPN
jgi:hypothetical protein